MMRAASAHQKFQKKTRHGRIAATERFSGALQQCLIAGGCARAPPRNWPLFRASRGSKSALRMHAQLCKMPRTLWHNHRAQARRSRRAFALDETEIPSQIHPARAQSTAGPSTLLLNHLGLTPSVQSVKQDVSRPGGGKNLPATPQPHQTTHATESPGQRSPDADARRSLDSRHDAYVYCPAQPPIQTRHRYTACPLLQR
mmetsp:Transcript_5949/g.15810  ORF Transcript_5949/g.15810 Transcript_5949/m.15810 type:complete len:200 (-) Transcript_5949:677-1276(-)